MTVSVNGNISFICGVQNSAITLDGVSDHIIFPAAGPLEGEFDTEDFSISFYFKPTGEFGTFDILSKREDCSADRAFAIRYSPISRTVEVLLSESSSKSASVIGSLPPGNCWQHLVVIRRGARTELYVNGDFLGERGAIDRVNIDNDAPLLLAKSPCQSATDIPFKGLIDELRIYNRALDEEEIRGLFLAPDRIINQDTIIFLGGSVEAMISNTCADNFTWSPANGIFDVKEAEPVIQPESAGVFVYNVDISVSGLPCIATDSVRITVVDPSDLDCSTVFVPNAFTPNGDGLNDTYGISNPYAIPNLNYFEIFDRWGGRVFFTSDPFEQWDGTFKGSEVNPGVFLYRIEYICGEEKKFAAGSLTVLR